ATAVASLEGAGGAGIVRRPLTSHAHSSKGRRSASIFLLLGVIAQNFINGQEPVIVTVDLTELFHRFAGCFPLVKPDLAVAVRVILAEPGRDVLGKIPGTINGGFLDRLFLLLWNRPNSRLGHAAALPV